MSDRKATPAKLPAPSLDEAKGIMRRRTQNKIAWRRRNENPSGRRHTNRELVMDAAVRHPHEYARNAHEGSSQILEDVLRHDPKAVAQQLEEDRKRKEAIRDEQDFRPTDEEVLDALERDLSTFEITGGYAERAVARRRIEDATARYGRPQTVAARRAFNRVVARTGPAPVV